MATVDYVLKMFNVELSVSDGNDLKVVKPADTESKLTVGSYKLGDVNNDGSVSVTDVGCTINYILEQPPSVFIVDAADMNGDKVISVTDVGMIINVILNDGAASRQKEQQIITDAHLSLTPVSDGYQLLLDDKDAFVGFQFDLQLADGATINDMRLNDENDHLLTYRRLDNGKYRVVCYSLTNSTFDGNGVALLNIATTGDMTISNIRLTTVGLNEVGFNDMNATPTGIADASGLIHQTSELKIYSLDGRLCRIIRVQPGENPLNGLKAGIYLIGNRKVIVK